MEIYKTIAGYEDEYEVSNIGNVKSKRRNGTKTDKDYYILKPKLDKDGYNVVTLSKNNKLKYVAIHKLVAETFIEKPKLQVNHKNGIRNDNRLENLEWVTSSENNKHSFRVLGQNGRGGHSHKKIIINGIEYIGIRQACKTLNINRDTLMKIIKNGKTEFSSYGKQYKIELID